MSIPFSQVLLRLGVATVLGGLIGLEREYRSKAAGLRTNILITLGSALFGILSLELGTANGSSDRVAAQIVTGIGFLGAGAILHSRGGVHGLTTAATIWVNAGIGVAAGVGSFAVATASTLMTLVVLALLPFLENRILETRNEHRPRQ
jgi:putative Mg2+ transporter-C (MgtC) family protein